MSSPNSPISAVSPTSPTPGLKTAVAGRPRGTTVVRHHFSDSERISFVDYINKHVVLPSGPIDSTSPTHLFEVVANGVALKYDLPPFFLICKAATNNFCSFLINKAFPGTIPEKKLASLSLTPTVFEKNINNEMSIQAAKELGGCFWLSQLSFSTLYRMQTLTSKIFSLFCRMFCGEYWSRRYQQWNPSLGPWPFVANYQGHLHPLHEIIPFPFSSL